MDTAAEFLKDVLLNKLGTTGVLLLILAAVCIYAWYQHHSKKLLQERIELEADKRRQLGEAMLEKSPLPSASDKISPPPGKTFTILVVDDEHEVVEIMRRWVSMTTDRITFIGAADGNEGLAIARTKHPDLIFMDVVMPGKDGCEVLKEMEKQGLHPPTVMISGYFNDLSDIKRMSGVHRNNLTSLAKPFKLSDVAEIIRANIRISEK